jgi:CheY-like chemotaxis protein
MTAGPASALILLVDRDAAGRLMYAEHLRRLTYEIDEAEDGREALAKAISRRPTVIVTATRLAGINGFELCRLLRNDPLTRAIPIIVVTDNMFVSDAKLAEAAGADAVLVKPCVPERLAEEIGRVLAASAAPPAPPSLGRREPSEEVLDRSRANARRTPRSHAYERRDTTEPPAPPPTLRCLICDRLLRYLHSHIGGVNERHTEQWDYFECAACRSMFEYRHRTRKTRPYPSVTRRIC